MKKIIIFCHISGSRQPTKDKTLKKKHFFDENLKRYCINVLKHGSFYNFYSSREVVLEFLTVFENNFIPNATLGSLGLNVLLQL